MLALVGLLLQTAVAADSCASAALLPAYAHNDYRNRRPLIDAVALGYRGVEADVFRVGNELLVGHKRGETRAPNTLKRLYLEPLRERQRTCGYVLADRSPFFLNIEIKESDTTAFSLLLTELSEYEELFPAVRVTLVGWWPDAAVGSKPWPDYLRHQLVVQRGANQVLPSDSTSIGLVSIDYGKVFSWRGTARVPRVDEERLAEARDMAERLAVPLRVHHVPANERVYRWLLTKAVMLGAADLERSRALIGAARDTSAAAPHPPWALWGVIAAWGSSHTAGGGAAAAAVTYQQRHRTYSLRVAVAGGPPCTASDCWPDAMDLSFLLGYGTRVGGMLQASAGAGLGLAGFRDDGGVGLAGELQLSLRPTRFLGVGLYGWGNSVGPQVGVALGVQLGRMR